MNNKDDYKKRISFLIDFAISEYNLKTGNPHLKEYVELAFDIAKKINYRFPKELHLKVCKYCFTIRTTKNTKYRTQVIIKDHKKSKYMKIHCLECNKIKKLKTKL
ncbi:MAG: ribonuclease P Rpr2/Rpp21/SNM1 subunit [archaeon]|jgi:RNase P subunit RPR2